MVSPDATGTAISHAILRPLTLQELAERLACRLEGDGTLTVHRVQGIDRAEPGDLTFLANPRYASALATTRATAVILSEGAASAPCAVLRTTNPYLAFARAVQIFDTTPRPRGGIDRLAAVADTAVIGEGCSFAAFVVIGDGAHVGARVVIHPNTTIGPGASIGDDCVIHSNVAIREGVRIGCRVVIQNGAVIGSDGFGFARADDGVSHEKIPQIGTVVIEDEVEIGANTTIDRPALGETRIGSGTKIDNLVQVAHGVSIGRHALLAAQVGIAGSTTIEDQVVLAGQVGVAGHITIGKGASATAQTGIPNSVKPGAFVSGYPAIDNRDWRRSAAMYRRLPELRSAFGELKREVEQRFGLLDRILDALREAGITPASDTPAPDDATSEVREHAGVGAHPTPPPRTP